MSRRPDQQDRPVTSAVLEASRSTRSGRLPDRYAEPYNTTFDALVRDALRPGLRILDVGGGRQPTVGPQDRPSGCYYVGLDLSREEMDKAGPGSYDRMVEADVTERIADLVESFDLILSWQVLEHVKPLGVAMENLRLYLRPGGRLIAQMSGKFSAFGLINQALPRPLGLWALVHLVGKSPSEVFPAYYHQCWFSALERILAPWSRREIIPLHVGAVPYWKFSRTLQSVYVGYEEWAYRRGHHNLASYYVVDASR